jgi:hypothetical protein
MMPEPQPESHWRVSLPMYNLPEMQAANAAFWEAIRRELERQGIESVLASLDFARAPVPERIERHTLLSQVCGYPQRAQHNFRDRGRVRVHARVLVSKLAAVTRQRVVASPVSATGHLRPDSEVGWGGDGQIGRRTRSGCVSAIHAKVAAVPASFTGASECLARIVSSTTSLGDPAAVG